MSDTRPFRQGSKLWLLETRAFQRLVAHLSTSRKDAAACVSLSFIYNVKEPEGFISLPASEADKNTTGPLIWHRTCILFALGSAFEGALARNPQCEGLYALAIASVKDALQNFLRFQTSAPFYQELRRQEITRGPGHFLNFSTEARDAPENRHFPHSTATLTWSLAVVQPNF